MTSAEDVRSQARMGRSRRPLTRLGAHALGNVFLGIAIGLIAYYFATDAISGFGQKGMRDAFAEVAGAAARPEPDRLVDDAGPALDFTEWAEEDGAFWSALPLGDAFGRLVIPRMDLDTVVVRGYERAQLRKGPGWITYTDLPGSRGNVGVAGHRTTYGAPFRRLDELRPGDTIDLYSPYRRYRYQVAESYRVRPDRVDVMATTDSPVLTLSACDPPFSAAYRLIVRAELVACRRYVTAGD